MSLDDLMRVRCEPELRERLTALAKGRRIKESQLAREILWRYVEETEAALRDAPAPVTPPAPAPAPVTYAKKKRAGRFSVESES